MVECCCYQSPGLWQPLAQLVLEASYEATLLAALKQAEKHGYAGNSNVVYLTMLGGGVFGNDVSWILESIHKACISVQECDLDVRTTCPFATCAHGGRQLQRRLCAAGNRQPSGSLHTPRHGLPAALTASWCRCRCAS